MVTIVWIDRVRSRAYQMREDDGEQHGEDRGADPQRHAVAVGEVVGEQGADDADQHDGEPVDRRARSGRSRNWATSATTSAAENTSVVLVRPKPRVSLM